MSTILLLCALAVTACGNVVNATEAGRIGVTADETGHPVAVVLICRPATPVVDLSEGRPPGDDGRTPSVSRGSWTANQAYRGVRSFTIGPAPAGWTRTGSDPGTLQPGTLFVLTGGTTGDPDTYLQQVSFRTADLAGLTPDRIRIEGETLSRAQFSAYECP